MVIHSKDLKIFKLSLFLSLYILIGSRFDSLRIWLIRPYRVICLEHITATLITTSLAKTFEESARVGVRDFGHNPGDFPYPMSFCRRWTWDSSVCRREQPPEYPSWPPGPRSGYCKSEKH